MDLDSKLFVAGARGLVGSAIVRRLEKAGFTRILTPARSELDLMIPGAVDAYMAENKPEYVFLAAAKVGGIHANSTYPAEFIYQNLMVQSHVIHSSYVHGVKKLLFLGSSCIYPKFAEQPMKEEYLMTGQLEETNSPYATAKIAGIEMCWAYNRQYGTCFLPVMPTNLYGPNDNFDLNSSHVLPALIRKFHMAKIVKDDYVTAWGTGTPRREFLHVDDMADACLYLMTSDLADLFNGGKPLVNIGTGQDVSIRELTEIISSVVGFQGQVFFDINMPDGTPRKLLDVSLLRGLGWQARIGLTQGIANTYEWFLRNMGSLRLDD